MLEYNILHNQFWEEEFQNMLPEYRNNKITYVRESYFNNWTYISKDFFNINKEQWYHFIQTKLWVINNSILKKAVFALLTKDRQSLRRIWITKEMEDVLLFTFQKQAPKNYSDVVLAYYWRYDLLLDTNNELKIVEINSETPAGFPESSHNSIILKHSWKENVYEDSNFYIVDNVRNSLQGFIEKNYENVRNWRNKLLFTYLPAMWDELEVVDNNGSLEVVWNYDDDYTCSLHMASMLYDILTPEGYEVKLGEIDDLEVREDGLYFNGEKQDYIYSFYPLEWIFDDNWAADFWNLYKNNCFEIVNNPLNLITQTKWIWAYIHEDIKNKNIIWLTEEEQRIFLELVPEYTFSIEEGEEDKYISKPFFFREWVWINNKDYAKEFPENVCYQKKIEQKVVNVNTFSFEEAEEWFLTIWVYMWEDQYIWIYTRFCADSITNDDAYYLPVVFDINK